MVKFRGCHKVIAPQSMYSNLLATEAYGVLNMCETRANIQYAGFTRQECIAFDRCSKYEHCLIHLH